jgi:hypothetical protein
MMAHKLLDAPPPYMEQAKRRKGRHALAYVTLVIFLRDIGIRIVIRR